jgi:hypothetical protein
MQVPRNWLGFGGEDAGPLFFLEHPYFSATHSWEVSSDMARFLSALPLALTIAALSAPANAGPTISTQGPGDGGAPDAGGTSSLSVICQVNGQSEPVSVVNGTYRDVDGIRDATVTELEPGVFFIDSGNSTMVLTATSAQVTGGPEAGKYDCVEVSAAPAPTGNPGAAPTGDPGALAAMEQRLATARAALAATQDDLIGAILDRDAARNSIAAAEGQRDVAQQDIRVLQGELAAIREAQAAAQAARAGAEAEVVAREAALLEARQQIRNGDLERAELEAGLAAAEATNAALSAELAAAEAENAALSAELAAAEAHADASDDAAEAMPEDDTDMAEADQDTTMMFDADAAMAMLEAAEISDISRAALMAAVEQARENPAMANEVMERLQNAMGQ